MEYIRKLKSQSSWEPNIKHCLYGLDADLIMLSLTTHEPHFILLREEVLKSRGAKQESDRFHLLHISLLREYFQLEFKNIPFQVDIERVIDDFILMCFFVGNDFLPNLPNQDIAEGALNTFLELYKKLLPKWKNYLTNKSSINLGLLEELLCNIAKSERDFFDLMPTNSLNISNNSIKKKTSSTNSQLSSSDEFLGLQGNVQLLKLPIITLFKYR
jgi:5'-3' exoribonuclease 1